MRAEVLHRGHTAPNKADSHGFGHAKEGVNEFALFFAGSGGRGKDLGTIRTRLTKIFPKRENGRDSFQAYDSVFFSTPHSKDKIPSASQLIVEKVNEGAHVTVMGHSMGGAEAVEAVTGTEDIEPDFLSKHAKDISLVLNTPATFLKNVKDGTVYLARYGKLLFDEMARTFYKSGFYRGLVSVTTLPPAKEIISQVTLKAGLREAFARRSNYDSSQPEHNYELDRDYLQLIDPKVRAEVNTLDRQLAALMTDPEKNKGGIRRVLKRRAKLTNNPIEEVYAMKYAKHFGDKPLETPQYKRSLSGMVDKVKLFGKTFITGKIYKQYHALTNRGVESTVELPDFDVMLKRKQAPDAVNIFGTHSSPIAAQPNMIGSKHKYALAA